MYFAFSFNILIVKKRGNNSGGEEHRYEPHECYKLDPGHFDPCQHIPADKHYKQVVYGPYHRAENGVYVSRKEQRLLEDILKRGKDDIFRPEV